MSAWEWVETETFDAALSASLFFSVVVLAMLACRQPARRILIARVALLASLAIIPLTRLNSLPRLDLVKVVLSSDLVPRTLFTSATADDPPPLPAISTHGRSIPNPAFRAMMVYPTSRYWRGVAHLVVLLVLAGMGAGFAWLLLGFAGVQWLIRHSHPPSTATCLVHEQLVNLRSRLGRRAVLRVSTRVHRPAVVGMLHPTILIPTSLDLPCGDPDSLRLSLLHELAHVDRYDYGFHAVANLAQTVWFFLPHTWWLRSQLIIDQEFLADQDAARRYGESSEYASSLLLMAAQGSLEDTAGIGDSSASALTGAKAAVPSALFQRILMLLHCPFPIETRTPRLWSWSLNLAVLGASVLAACLVIRWPNVVSVGSPSKTQPVPISRRFHVASFVAEPLPGPPNGRSIAYVLPLTLPSLFDLDVEVRSTPNDLDQIRIAGYPLKNGPRHETSHTSIPASGSPEGKSWHRVHVHRDQQNVIVEVDGRPISDESLSEVPSDWLTIEPGSQNAAEFRELTVSW